MRQPNIYKPDGALDRSEWVEVSLVRGRRLTRAVLQILRGTGGMIAGGFPRWCASPRKDPGAFKDIDVFCSDDATLARVRCACAAFGLVLDRENVVSFCYRPKRRWFGPSIPTLNVIKPVEEGRIRTKGDLLEILHNFDFTIVKVGILDEHRAIAHHCFLADERARRLRFTRMHTPVTAILRAMKYAKRGYRLSLRETLRIFAYWDGFKRHNKKRIKDFIRVEIEEPDWERIAAPVGVVDMGRRLLAIDERDDAREDEDEIHAVDVYRLMLAGS